MMREVNSPFVKVLYDLYHVQIMEGNLIETIRSNVGAIGHIHVADVPGRHEPGTGEIQFENVFRAIEEVSYDGFVGMEYVPSKPVMKTLAEAKALAKRAKRAR